MPHEQRTGDDTSGERVVDTVVEELEIDPGERTHVTELMAWVKKCEDQTWPDNKKIVDVCDRNRTYVEGKQGSDGQSGLVRANLIQANIRKSVNRTYARNPELSIVPTEAVTATEYKLFREFGKTSEIVVNSFLKKARIKSRAKAALRAAKTCRVGWVKVGLQKRLETDAHIQNKINDLQDNLQTLERLKLEASDPEFNDQDQDTIKRLILERQQLLEGLQQGVEVVKAEGIVLDLIKTENMILDVTQLETLDDYAQSERIGQKFFLDPKTAIERYGKKGKALTIWSIKSRQNDSKNNNNDTKESEKQSKQTKQWEIWDRKTLKFYTIGDGYPGYLKNPVSPSDEVGEQWYPYFPLALNRVDGRFWPIADVELLMELQDEISSSLTKFKDHRQKSIPFSLIDKQSLEPEDLKKIADPQPFELIPVKPPVDKPVKEIIHNVDHNAIDPQVYLTDHLERKMEQVTGASEPSQPRSNRSKTLGEAKILTQDVATDSTSDQDEIEEWYKDLATYVWQILLKVLSPGDVVKIAGEGAQWPEAQMSLPRIYNQLRLEVKPGSSGKPDKIRELESLTTLMPPVNEMLLQLADFKEKGQDDLADTQTKIIREFLRRADEKFDVEEFFPASENEEEEKAQREEEKAAKQQEEQELLALEKSKSKSEIDKNNSEAEKNLALADAALNPPPQQDQDTTQFDMFKIDEESALARGNAELKAAADVQINKDKLEANLRLEREKIDSLERIAQIEVDGEIRKARILENIADKKIAAESNNKDKEVAAQVEAAEISAKASENTNSDTSSDDTTQKLTKVIDEAKSAKGDDALAAIIKGLTEVIKQSGGPKKIIFNEANKPVGIEPGKPGKRTVN